MKVKKNSIYWFKRDLRLHDNKVLCDCIYKSTSFYPVYILEDN